MRRASGGATRTRWQRLTFQDGEVSFCTRKPGDADVALTRRDLGKALAIREQLRGQGGASDLEPRARAVASRNESCKARVELSHTPLWGTCPAFVKGPVRVHSRGRHASFDAGHCGRYPAS